MSSSSAPVIVGVSGDQPSVISHGAHEAARLKTFLRVVHCSTNLAAGTDAMVLARARAVVDSSPVAVEVDYVLEQGDPRLLLVDHARSAAALVIGADDVEWTERVLDGKVSSVLALGAACPVTVVPQQLGEDSSSAVIVALDGDTSTAGPLRYGFEQADFGSEELHVLHAAPAATTADDTAVFTARVQREVERFQQIAPDVRARLWLTSGDSLEECIKTTTASLLVIGRPPGRGPRFALTRPVAMLVLREARCAVVVVPSGYGRA